MNTLKNIISENPNLISGIYNYCDRWCEKCKQTERCTIYTFEKSLLKDNTQDNMSELLKQAIELLEEIEQEQNIELESNILLTEEEEKTNNEIEEEIKNKSFCILAKNYDDLVSIALEKIEGCFAKKEKEIYKKIDLDIDVDDSDFEFDSINTSLEIIINYHYFIYIKLLRAVDAKLFNIDLREDYNGIAKVALITIKKSFDAWKAILNIIPELQDEVIDILATLQKLEREVKQDFPEAKNFIRIGFEEDDTNFNTNINND